MGCGWNCHLYSNFVHLPKITDITIILYIRRQLDIYTFIGFLGAFFLLNSLLILVVHSWKEWICKLLNYSQMLSKKIYCLLRIPLFYWRVVTFFLLYANNFSRTSNYFSQHNCWKVREFSSFKFLANYEPYNLHLMGNANLRKSGLELRSKCNDFNTAWKGAQQIEIFFCWVTGYVDY